MRVKDQLPRGIVPRGLNLPQAAQYVGISERTFESLVASGQLPRPVTFANVRRAIWDIKALDLVLDRLSGILNDSDAQEYTAADVVRNGQT